eukprot:TRINITY_DN29300_c0_g1_i1.p1 TRINITY_DN29300_c0_g1~~TRINITY_DN29300_c0_g1_i1.p1  ORF type:complete len:394 (+),score=38.86 TRINITY_DN29300_c0_g1_i1:63-1244(+)
MRSVWNAIAMHASLGSLCMLMQASCAVPALQCLTEESSRGACVLQQTRQQTRTEARKGKRSMQEAGLQFAEGMKLDTSASNRALRTCIVSPPYMNANLPDWICYLKLSVEKNAGLEFHLISNSTMPTCADRLSSSEVQAGKFIHHRFNPMDFSQRLRSKLNFTAIEANEVLDNVRNRPYSSNDLKPSLGYLYEDWLEGCDLWGWSDIDLVFGDTSAIQTHVADYDVFCPYAPFTLSSGTLMLFQNVPRTRNLFLSSKDWKHDLLSTKYDVLDEWWGSKDLDSMQTVLKRSGSLRQAADGRAIFGQCQADIWNKYLYPNCTGVVVTDEMHRQSDLTRTVTWQNGKLTVKTHSGVDSPVYFHFISWKKQESESFVISPLLNPDCFIIQVSGVSPC